MKNSIQDLILELKVEREKASQIVEQNGMFGGIEEGFWLGQTSAFSQCIRKLTLLLNSENEKQR